VQLCSKYPSCINGLFSDWMQSNESAYMKLDISQPRILCGTGNYNNNLWLCPFKYKSGFGNYWMLSCSSLGWIFVRAPPFKPGGMEEDQQNTEESQSFRANKSLTLSNTCSLQSPGLNFRGIMFVVCKLTIDIIRKYFSGLGRTFNSRAHELCFAPQPTPQVAGAICWDWH
jgi:hypothetical protein